MYGEETIQNQSDVSNNAQTFSIQAWMEVSSFRDRASSRDRRIIVHAFDCFSEASAFDPALKYLETAWSVPDRNVAAVDKTILFEGVMTK
jgi:hypothetical protein